MERRKIHKVYYTWNEFEDFINRVVNGTEYFKVPENCTGVYGIPRGGLVIAVTLSHRLGIPLLNAPCENCIVVDDIDDTGLTLAHYYEKNYKVVTMVYRECKKVSGRSPDYSRFIQLDDSWVVFPWEDHKIESNELIDDSSELEAK